MFFFGSARICVNTSIRPGVEGLLVVVVGLLVVIVVVVGLLLLVVVVVSAVVLGGVTSLVAGLELNFGAVWRTDVTLNLPESLH